MTTATATLTEFLLARIADREAAALAATPGPWFALEDAVSASPEERDEWGDRMGNAGPHVMHASFEENGPANAAHIALHDPARVLAECEAKRRIVEWAETSSGEFHWGSVLAPLAAVYADHPDYREEWAL